MTKPPKHRPRPDSIYVRYLARGVDRFRKSVFPKRQPLFKRLARSQQPKALFLTCADSRVVPALITQTKPGELFVERNPGNLVPVYSTESVGVSASIEYAITALGTHHVIVCGHSDCGAVKGILHPEQLAAMPAVARWLRFGEEALGLLQAQHPQEDEATRIRLLTRLNVVVQMEHLKTHPAVQAALVADRLEIHGWVYDIETGDVWAWDAKQNDFGLFPAEP